MAALIKNALIKHLSKFLKNVSANQINISTFKGEGEMKNIQLDENLLMDLMEIPTWLRITSARCNKAGIKIPWTKLKTNPIVIALDKIELDVEIADPLREYSTNKDSKLFDKEFGGSYGFIDKCIDAIQLNIDSITVTLKSEKFNLNLNMSNIYIYSTTPHWKPTNDIRNTRLKDLDKDEILLFKEFSWEICRLEAFNIDPSMPAQQQQASSIKLIMNPSKIQIAMKKKLSDKSLITSTLRVLLNEIYWMANDTQLKSAIGTYNLIAKLMKKSFAQRRKYATLDQQQQQQQQANKPKPATGTQAAAPSGIDISKVFKQYDIKETSMHLVISNLNIHLYADDNYSGNKLIDGGAMQLLFKDICIDYYPYHRFGSTTRHWHNYNPTFKQREEWSKRLFDEFIEKIESILNKSCMFSSESLGKLRLKDNINLLEACTVCTLKDFCMFKVTTNMSNKAASGSGIKSKKSGGKASNSNITMEQKLSDLDELYTPNELLKNELYFIEQQMFNKKAFISSNYAEFNLPPETLFAQCFFSEFYFPQDANYPLPPAQIFIQVAPILVNIDFLTLLWINTLMFSLWREKLIQDQNNVGQATTARALPPPPTNVPLIDHSSRFNLHCDTFFEVVMPKISLTVYPSDMKASENIAGFINRPSGVEVGFSRVVFSNQSVTRFADARKVEQLRSTSVKCYELAREIISKNSDPNGGAEIELNQLAPCFNHLLQNENLYYVRYDFAANDKKVNVNITNEAHKAHTGLFLKSLNKNSLNKASNKDIWLLECENMWLDFLGFVNDQNSSLLQNTSFKFWIVNVWDFYSTPNFLNSTAAEKVEEIQEEENQKKLDNTLKKLADIIQIPDSVAESASRRRVMLKQKRSKSLSLASKLVISKKKSDYLCKKIYSKLNVIGELGDLQMSINHSKMLFLLRLMNVVDFFTEQMKQDTEQTLKHNKINVNADSKADKNNYNSTGAKLTRINSMNMEDWFVNNLIEEKKLDDTFYAGENADELSEPPFSVNLAVIVNSIQLELNINDLIPPNLQKASKQNLNLSDNVSIAGSVLAIDDNADNISRRSFNLESTQKLASSPKDQSNLASKEDNLSHRSLDLLLDVKHSKHQIRQEPGVSPLAQITPIVQKDEFDIVYRNMDRDYMFSYIRFVYGVSSENPNSHLAYQNTVNSLHFQSMNQPQIMVSNYGASNNLMNEKLSEKDRSSSISSISSSVSNQGSNSLTKVATKTSFISSLAKSLKTPTKIPQVASNNDELGDDLASLMDDNDNANILLALEQDDNSSVLSLDVTTPILNTPQSNENLINKFNMAAAASNPSLLKSKSMSSTNTVSSSVDSGSVRLPNETSIKNTSNISGVSEASQDHVKPVLVDQTAQTEQSSRNIVFRLGNVKVYAQTQDENVVALVKLDQVNMFEDKKAAVEFSSKRNKQSKPAQSPDIILKYKKISDDPESKDGLVDLKLDSFQFDIDIPTLNGLVDLIDDTDNFIVHSTSLTAKEMLLVNVHLRQCRFFLKDHPHSVIENNPKVLDLNIERLSLTKLPNNQIVIKEVQMKSSDMGVKKLSSKKPACSDKLFSNLQSLIKFQKDYEVEKRISNAKSDKYASIVYMLRKAKEDQSNLRVRLENERARFEEEKSELRMKLNLSHMENQELKKTIELARASATNGDNTTDEFILADKKESAADQFDLERKQFESLLKQLQEENERLNVRLQKSEEHITILNIERECLMKNIDKIK